MSDKVHGKTTSQTGAMPRIESQGDESLPVQPPPPPATLPEFPEDGASTGLVSVVSEDSDDSAQRDEDSPTGR